MKNFPATPREIAASLWRNRSLVKASIKREVLKCLPRQMGFGESRRN